MSDSENKEIEIGRAQAEDAEAIAELANGAALDTVSKRDRAKRGYLVSGFSAKDYARFISLSEYFFVARQGERIVGFVFACSSEDLPSDWKVEQQIKRLAARAFTLIKQVFVSEAVADRGVGTRLYRTVFAASESRPIFASIVVKPDRNERSIAFHLKHGFREAIRIQGADKRWRGVYRRPADAGASGKPLDPRQRLDVLLEQYRTYGDLFRHEDNLTWDKLHKLVLLTSALTAAFALTLREYPALALLIAVCGTLLSLWFLSTICNGALFISMRRQQWEEIEESLHEFGALDLARHSIKRVDTAGRSDGLIYALARTITTRRTLAAVPAVLCLSWILLGAMTYFTTDASWPSLLQTQESVSGPATPEAPAEGSPPAAPAIQAPEAPVEEPRPEPSTEPPTEP